MMPIDTDFIYMKKKNSITILIETPKNSQLKFDYDKKLRCCKLNKMLPAGMVFPFDFGFIPGTKGGDGDPLDVIAISEFNSFPGCAMDCRIIGAILAEQTEKEGKTVRNDRFFGIPLESEQFRSVEEIHHLPGQVVSQIEDFFINYNREAGKQFKVLDTAGSDAALKLIKKSREK